MLASGNVAVRSAVGSVTASVSSKASSVAPSKTREPVEPIFNAPVIVPPDAVRPVLAKSYAALTAFAVAAVVVLVLFVASVSCSIPALEVDPAGK